MRRAALLAVAVLAAGCGSGAPAVPDGAIALVGDRPVPRSELDAELAQTRRAYAAQGRAFPAEGTPAYDRLRDVVVRLVVERAQTELWAEERGIVITAGDVDRRLGRVKQQLFGGDEKGYRDALRREGMSDPEMRASVRVLLLTEALRPAPKDDRPPIVYAPGLAPG